MEPVVGLLFLLAVPVLLYTVPGMLPGSAHLPRSVRVALLVAGTTGVACLLTASLANQHWWSTWPALLLVLMTAMMWDLMLADRRGRFGITHRLLLPWSIRLSHGRRPRTLDEVRAEYAQGLLDDAARDPVLNRILDDITGRIIDTLRDDLRMGDPRMAAQALRAHVNHYLDQLSDPGRDPVPPIYRDYSTDMVTVAAMCRAADRLRTT